MAGEPKRCEWRGTWNFKRASRDWRNPRIGSHPLISASSELTSVVREQHPMDRSSFESSEGHRVSNGPNGEAVHDTGGAIDLAAPTITQAGTNAANTEDKRRVVVVREGRIDEVVDEAEVGMIAAGAPLFVRGEVLVRLGEATSAGRGTSRTHAAPILVAARPPMILEEMERACRFVVKRRAPGPESGESIEFTRTVRCPPPAPAVYLSRVGSWRMPCIAGIAEVPFVLPDGHGIATAGVHEGALVVAPGDWGELPVPTEDNARSALALLCDLLTGYAFVADMDKAVTVAALLTAAVRPWLPSAPAFAWSAPVRGSGKSKLADVVSIIATGRTATTLSWVADEAECEKRLGSALLAGDPVLLFDNIEAPVRGQLINSVLTQESVSIRILGQSAMQRINARALSLMTGNNLSIHGDLTRRVLVAEIDPRDERPELRRFDFDPVARARSSRRALWAAAVTVMRWGTTQANCFAPFGSFEDWSTLVRSPLIALGMADPCGVLDRLVRDDPEREEAIALLVAWHNAFGSAAASAAQAIKRAEEDEGLRDAALAVARVGDRISSKRLGHYLKKIRARIVGEFVLCSRLDSSTNAMMWRIERQSRQTDVTA